MSTSRELVVYDPKQVEALPDPWLRQPAEPEEAWKAFTEYRSQYLPRDIRRMHGRHQTVQDFARDYKWAKRVEAYDNMCEAHAVKERLAAIATVAREAGAADARLLMRSYELLNVEITKLLRLAEDPSFKETSVMKTGDLVKLAELIMKMGRLSTGQSTENVVVASFGANLSDDEQMRLWELTRKGQGT